MITNFPLFALCLLLTQTCASNDNSSKSKTLPISIESSIEKTNCCLQKQGMTVQSRFNTPSGFERIIAEPHSFAGYLRQLPLKPIGAEVKLYNGNTKPNYNVYEAVVDLPIGTRDLHQCADAVMRLRAEYLWKNKRYNDIHFNFTNGFRVNYSEWMKGNRIAVNGNKVSWVKRRSPSNTYTDFWKYMEIIFAYAGTLSLDKELKPVSMDDVRIGDVFIQGGSPGHAVIVIDIAVNTDTNERLFMLAQSYMPAQEIQILQNPNNSKITPWYALDFGEILRTPEWDFNRRDLKRFGE